MEQTQEALEQAFLAGAEEAWRLAYIAQEDRRGVMPHLPKNIRKRAKTYAKRREWSERLSSTP